jgi:CubicO group peptidase (beta-lactamase class C family)
MTMSLRELGTPLTRPLSLVALAPAALLVACSMPVKQSLCTPTASDVKGQFRDVEQLLRSCVEDGAFPGAVLTVGSRDSILYSLAVGHYGDDDLREVSDSTVYDLASLTKVIGLTTAVMLLVSEGSLDIDSHLSSFFPQYAELPSRGSEYPPSVDSHIWSARLAAVAPRDRDTR